MRIGFFYSSQQDLENRPEEFRHTRMYEIFMPIERRGGWGFLINLHFFGFGAWLTTDGLSDEEAQAIIEASQTPTESPDTKDLKDIPTP
jgi:hypothetical protein